MLKTISIIILLSLSAQAGQVLFNQQNITYNDSLSLRDFAEQYVDIPNGTTVYASYFSHEIYDPMSVTFRHDMSGVMFYNCGLCNVNMPPSNSIIDFYHDSGCQQ